MRLGCTSLALVDARKEADELEVEVEYNRKARSYLRHHFDYSFRVERVSKNICLPKGSEKIDEGLDKKVQTVGYCTLKLVK